jgi:UDP-glucuronate 4-epimerase
MYRRVCVTGGLGFIGSHLSLALAERGCEVVCVDCLSGDYGAGTGLRAAAELAGLPNVSVVRADVARDDLEPLLEGVDAVLHLAAVPGVRTRRSFADLWDENALTTGRLAAAAAARGARLVLASTSSVYGDAPRLPTSERTPPSPLSLYAVSKLAAEQVCRRAAHTLGADAVVARLFTVFGPGQRPDMAIARWLDGLASGRPILWCAHPEARRELTYVADAVDGLLSVLERGAAGDVYNVAGCGSVAMSDVLLRLEGILGRDADVVRRRPSSSEAIATEACGAKAARELGYRPHIALEDGLRTQWEAHLAPADPLEETAGMVSGH